jgi:hypothetical protein
MLKRIINNLPVLVILTIFAILMAQVIPAAAESGLPQAVVPTPTAQPDGRIIYIAQPGDSWWIISVKTGVAETQLYLLNNTKPEDLLQAGQQILLGVVTPTPPIPASDIALTPTPISSTPEVPGFGQICVLLYDDINGDSVRQLEELPLPGGAISLANSIGTINKTAGTTAGPEPVCFDEVPEGDYNLSVAIPDGYNPTTVTNAPLILMAGDQTTMNFGAQLSSLAQPQNTADGGRNPILGIAGLILLLCGAGMGVFIWLKKGK